MISNNGIALVEWRNSDLRELRIRLLNAELNSGLSILAAAQLQPLRWLTRVIYVADVPCLGMLGLWLWRRLRLAMDRWHLLWLCAINAGGRQRNYFLSVAGSFSSWRLLNSLVRRIMRL